MQSYVKQNENIKERRKLLSQFESVFRRLLNREKLDLYEEDMSFLFELMARNLIYISKTFDGAVDFSFNIRKPQQIEFKGRMWIMEDGQKKPFKARITDKRLTKQGIHLKMWVGSEVAEANLLTAFGLWVEIN